MSKGGAAPAAGRGGGSAFQSGMNTFTSCNKAGSIPHFNQHLAKHPNDFNALWYRGTAHAIIGQSTEALRDFRQAERVSSGAEKEAVTALLQGLQGNNTNRRRILQRAVQMYPDNGLLWQEYGGCLSSDKNYSEAQKAHQNVIALNYPFAYYSHFEMGKIYRREGNKQDAARQFETAITKCPTFTIAHLNLGEVLEEEGKTQAASRHFERAKTLNPVLFESWEKGRRGNASYSGRGRGGAGGGRGGGGNSSGSDDDDDDDDDRPRNLFDPKAESDPTWNYKYKGQKIYKINDYCYMKDRAGDRGHGGSYWKVFKHYKSKLVLSHAENKDGKRINKHESNEGLTIWKNDLVGYTRKNRP